VREAQGQRLIATQVHLEITQFLALSLQQAVVVVLTRLITVRPLAALVVAVAHHLQVVMQGRKVYQVKVIKVDTDLIVEVIPLAQEAAVQELLV
jgi:hypothetical protein